MSIASFLTAYYIISRIIAITYILLITKHIQHHPGSIHPTTLICAMLLTPGVGDLMILIGTLLFADDFFTNLKAKKVKQWTL